MSAAKNDCIFCKIILGEIPSKRIYEDDRFFAFLDIFPAGRGHTLVIPKEHHADIHAISADLYGQLAASAKKVADLLQRKLGSEGTTIFQMNKEPGWQTVFHIHMHVIPRWSGDALHKPWDIAPADNADLEALHTLLTE
jgi:histidine triad (HIT) family protein